MDEAIQALDWHRMFLGDEPPLFLLEIAVRSAIIYVYTLALLRWLGSRTIGQLSTIEFLLVIALGSAVGDAMFYPDVPLAHALLVITIVVVANKALDKTIAKSATAERVIDGVPVEVVRDGVVNSEFLDHSDLSQGELFQQLRQSGVMQLGEVARAYLETNGTLTVIRAKKIAPGLPIVPPWELEEPRKASSDDSEGDVVCRYCGNHAIAEDSRCSNCDHDVWVEAVVSPFPDIDNQKADQRGGPLVPNRSSL